jgi:DNA-binding NtrC family response regulator
MWMTASTDFYRFRGRILVVDQDEWCREFLSQVIKLWGFGEYSLATTVDEALDFLEKLSFDLLIADLNLPQYRRLLEDCRQRFPSMRLILMLQQRSQMYQVINLEQIEIVVKPLSLDEMARKIREAIHYKHRLRVEEEILRLKQEAFRI